MVTFIKTANKQIQFKQNPLSKEKNCTCKGLILAYYKLFIAENVIVTFNVRNRNGKIWKFTSVFYASTRKYIGENSTKGDNSIMSNEVIEISCHITA